MIDLSNSFVHGILLELIDYQKISAQNFQLKNNDETYIILTYITLVRQCCIKLVDT
jgi:hypothetical protein